MKIFMKKGYSVVKSENKGQWTDVSEYNVLDGRFHYFITCSVCGIRVEKYLRSHYPTNCPHCHSSMTIKRVLKEGAKIG